MTTPTTDAGRALVDDEMGERLLLATGGSVCMDEDAFVAAILAIEQEAAEKAVASVLDALAREVREDERCPDCAGDVIHRLRVAALIEQHRPKGGPG